MANRAVFRRSAALPTVATARLSRRDRCFEGLGEQVNWQKPVTARATKSRFIADGRANPSWGEPQLLERELSRYISAIQIGDPNTARIGPSASANIAFRKTCFLIA